jgi:subtilisin family serine protease
MMRSIVTRRRRIPLLVGLAAALATPVWAQPMQPMQPMPRKELRAKSLSDQEFVDAGDFYWHDGQRIGLRRSNRELAVGFADGTPQSSVEAAVRALPRVDARRARRAGQTGGRELWVLPLAAGAARSELEATMRAVRGRAGVEYAHPVLYQPETNARVMLTNDVVVKLQPGRTLSDLASAMRSAGLVQKDRLLGTTDEFILRLDRPGSLDALVAAQRLQESGIVAWAQPDFIQQYHKAAAPNDTRWANLWHLHNTGQGGGTPDADVDAPEAWDISAGSSSIIIAVIDDGVQTAHEDLVNNIYTNPSELLNGIDDDANGYVDDYRGWDFVNNNNDPNPNLSEDNHGTAVAGVAAARGNNALGVTGSCRLCRILPVQIGFGTFPDSHYATAIRYAATKADVLNNSWGSGTMSATIQSAIRDAVRTGRNGRGSVVLFATGNSASGLIGPFSFDLPAGNNLIRWQYMKDDLFFEGSDTAWLAWAVLPGPGFPNGQLITFESGSPPGWVTGSSPGSSGWSIVTDRIHTDEGLCLTRALKAGATLDFGFSGVEVVRNVPAGGGIGYFYIWISSEVGYDGIQLGIDYGNNNSWDFLSNLISDNPAVATTVSYPAAYPESIAVAATTDMDCRSYYSQYGPEVSIAASSSGGPINNSIETTDRMFSAGYETSANGHYTLYNGPSGFGGTSSATPLASGIAGLVLSVNPKMQPYQVRALLQRSTDKVGTALYVNGRNNGHGYGRINAFKAVTAARDFIFGDDFQ